MYSYNDGMYMMIYKLDKTTRHYESFSYIYIYILRPKNNLGSKDNTQCKRALSKVENRPQNGTSNPDSRQAK